jgi:PAS domain S-box-containing protein
MTGKPTILAVDDTPSVLAVLVALLTPDGYLVRTAGSGEQALAAVATSPPDLILLDVQMGDLDGTEVCRRLKENEQTRHVPIILISGYAEVEDWVAGLHAGASDYITKPFRSAELLTRVRTHLALRRTRLALEEEASMLLETTTRLEAEIAERKQVEARLRHSLEQAERSRRALLSAMEDQKQIEAALRASEAKYRELTENLNDVVFTITDEGVLSYISSSIFAMSGYAPEELVGKPFTAFVVPEDLPELQQSMRAGLGGHIEPSEFRCRAKDGRIRWVRSSSRPMVEGDRVVGLRGVLSDVTEHRAAEDAQRAEAERLNRILEATSGGVWDWNIVTGEAVFSPRYASMLGYTPAEFAESYKDWKSLVHSDDFERVHQHHMDHFHRNQEFSIEYRLREKSGAWHWIHSRGLLIERDSQGNPARMVGTHTDIQQRKLAEAKREELEAQLLQSQKMESIGRLAGGVAHDFNNCLNVIQGFAQLCLAGLPENDPLADNLAQVLKASERAALLTRQLLAFGRKQVLQPEVLDLNRVLAEMERLLRRIIGEDIELVHHFAPDLGLVRADPGQFGQVIMNLAVNARDAMPGGGRLTIATANEELDAESAAQREGLAAGPYVAISVTDTGKGMDGPTLARIFEPFFTTKGLGKGSGLGLSTAYGTVKQSGGAIHVESEVGRGTTFKIYLPRELSAAAAIDSRTRSDPVRATGDETILVVEDEEGLRLLVTRFLHAAGYTVLAAADGEQALLASQQHAGKIDLLLTDVVMPRMNGRQLAERLHEIRPGLKLLYMSGYPDQAIIDHGVLATGTQLLAKPFTEADLTRKVRAVLDGMVSTTGANWPTIKEEVAVQPLDRDALRRLPEDVIAGLHQAAIAANYDELNRLLAIVGVTEPELAAVLQRMVDRFDYDGVEEVL